MTDVWVRPTIDPVKVDEIKSAAAAAGPCVVEEIQECSNWKAPVFFECTSGVLLWGQLPTVMEGYLAMELDTTSGPNHMTKPAVDNLGTINLVNGFRYRALARKGLWKVEAVFYPGATLPIGYVCHHVDVNGPDLVRRAARSGISRQNDHEDLDIVSVDRYDWSRWGCPSFGYQLMAMLMNLEKKPQPEKMPNETKTPTKPKFLNFFKSSFQTSYGIGLDSDDDYPFRYEDEEYVTEEEQGERERHEHALLTNMFMLVDENGFLQLAQSFREGLTLDVKNSLFRDNKKGNTESAASTQPPQKPSSISDAFGVNLGVGLMGNELGWMAFEKGELVGFVYARVNDGDYRDFQCGDIEIEVRRTPGSEEHEDPPESEYDSQEFSESKMHEEAPESEYEEEFNVCDELEDTSESEHDSDELSESEEHEEAPKSGYEEEFSKSEELQGTPESEHDSDEFSDSSEEHEEARVSEYEEESIESERHEDTPKSEYDSEEFSDSEEHDETPESESEEDLSESEESEDTPESEYDSEECSESEEDEEQTSYGSPGASMRKCYNCGNSGHIAEDCSRYMDCIGYGQYVPRDCPNPRKRRHGGPHFGQRKVRHCDHCHGDGHTRDRCYDLYPELRMQFGAPRGPKSEYDGEFSESEGQTYRCSSPGGSTTVCFYCGNTGHIAEDCSRYMDCIGYGQYVPRDCPNPRKRKHGGPHFGQRKVRHCDHCHRDGHTRDRCYDLYPELRMQFGAPRGPKSEYDGEFSESEGPTYRCSSPGRSTTVCFYCGNTGHIAEDCSRYMDCIGYGQYVPRDCPNPRKRKHGGPHFGQRKVRHCDHCHRDGHTPDRCFDLYPELRTHFKAPRTPEFEFEEFGESEEHEEQISCCSSPGGSIPVCFYCCNSGHVAEDCSRYMDCIGYGQYIPKDRPNARKRKHEGCHFGPGFGQREVRYLTISKHGGSQSQCMYVLDQ